VRTFETPALPAGKAYSYEIKAEYRRGGKLVSVKRTIRMEAGKTINLDMNQPAPAPVAKAKKVLEITKHPRYGYGITFELIKELTQHIPTLRTGTGGYRGPTDKEIEELVKKGILKVVPPRPGESFTIPREKKTLDE
jgi:hypothetical protein